MLEPACSYFKKHFRLAGRKSESVGTEGKRKVFKNKQGGLKQFQGVDNEYEDKQNKCKSYCLLTQDIT